MKEADALSEASFRVHVVFAQGGSASHRAYDESLLRQRPWSSTAVQIATRNGRPLRWVREVAFQRLAQLVPRRLWMLPRIVEHAESRIYRALARTAASIEADLYIGHYAEGLAAAAFAADRNEAHLGFDAEDFHTGEANPRAQCARIDYLQRRYLPRCSYVSAASAGDRRSACVVV